MALMFLELTRAQVEWKVISGWGIMMSIIRKVLWIVDMDTSAAETQFAQYVQAAGIDTVCIRTSSTRLPAAIARFKALNKTVWCWRWPWVLDQPSAIHQYAIDEANFVAKTLIPNGLDGYIADPESDGHINKKTGQPLANDWDQKAVAPLAKQFCSIIRTAAQGKKFIFGTTSGCAYPDPAGKADIPWNEFFTVSDALYPQCYWWMNVVDEKTKKEIPTKINGGTPAAATTRGIAAWTPAGMGKPIYPIAGETNLISAAETKAFGDILISMKVPEANFYMDKPPVDHLVLDAIKSIPVVPSAAGA